MRQNPPTRCDSRAARRTHSNLELLDPIRFAGPGASAHHPRQEGALISHLQYMVEHQGEGDNHNAEPFAQCYRRLADLIPQLISEGCNPRIMLDYSGNLLWGVEQMGRNDISGALRYLACDPLMQRHVEWLGTFWSHAVAPSTPIPDLKLQISAWQHQFAALFGTDALQRVRGFSPPEMHLPNHPDTLYEFISALKDCGYRWLLVQEHSVESLSGEPLSQRQKYLPNQLIARNSSGATVSITALIKTQGSDTKLVGQMQPCYEALGLQRQQLGDLSIPSLVSQIADGEHGGVMTMSFSPPSTRPINGSVTTAMTASPSTAANTSNCSTRPGSTATGFRRSRRCNSNASGPRSAKRPPPELCRPPSTRSRQPAMVFRWKGLPGRTI